MNAMHRPALNDIGLLFLRTSGGLLLLWVHGLPKLMNYQQQLQVIEDPLHLGQWPTLAAALFAEIICPLLIIAGFGTRLACLPILFLLLIALVVVHPEWTMDQAQFGWLLTILFCTLALTGPGRLSLDAWRQHRHAQQPLTRNQLA
ncbi:DoxX family protein [Pseudomonas asuensis]|uniref:LysR family transcriptional regulator n=1 Tax=Pseudomonas asuensis TaxID=1825787 RepID=A0ABQ2GVW0_9PSED|nr:DoxX family protein [Pseudomonas asuensis]GGM16220.1 LysR family transcriptional regulator [Pseudomonas asuensis]